METEWIENVGKANKTLRTFYNCTNRRGRYTIDVNLSPRENAVN